MLDFVERRLMSNIEQELGLVDVEVRLAWRPAKYRPT